VRLSPRRIDAPTAAVVAAVGATAAAAFAGLLLWGDGMPGHSDSASAADTATSWPATLLFCGGWLLMTVAMMLPTSLPLFVAVRRVAGAGRDGRFVLPLVVVGYLAVWAVAGIAARAFSLGAPRRACVTGMTLRTRSGRG
jgi:predicted metal-binding membrane protein